MKTKLNFTGAGLMLALFSSLGLQPSTALAQGNLTPPGAPAPMMVTLSQIEPRTPVDATHTPGNGMAEFVISQPGSYYLTANIVGISSEHGIDILTNNVTLDLNGFSLLGTGSSGSAGIAISNGCISATVRNGTISGWPLFAVSSYAGNATFDHLNITQNHYGLYVYAPSVIRDCAVGGNSEAGIGAETSDSLVCNNVCVSNLWGIAIGGSNNRIEDNHILGNSSQTGILVSSTTVNNIIIRNSAIGCANDYNIPSVQITGPIITSTLTGTITNSNPWANFAF